MKIWVLSSAVVALATALMWLVYKSKSHATSQAERQPLASPTTAPTSGSGSDRLEPLYERTVHGRVVHVTRGHVAAASWPMHGALTQTRSGQRVSVALFTPIEKLDDVDDLESPELLSGTAFDGNCEVSLFMYVDAGKDARSCAEAFDPSRDLHGHRETLDLAKRGVDESLFADAIDFEEQGVPLHLVRVFGVVEDLCFSVHATMRAEADRQLGLGPLLVDDLSITVEH